VTGKIPPLPRFKYHPAYNDLQEMLVFILQVLLPVQYIATQGNQHMIFYPLQQGQPGKYHIIIA